MSKKSKRQTRSTSGGGSRRNASRKTSSSQKAAEQDTQSTLAPSFSTRSQRDEFNPDYTHIIKDLHRIGILAGSFLLVLIALAFLMPYILH
jgi:hypothetical protein